MKPHKVYRLILLLVFVILSGSPGSLPAADFGYTIIDTAEFKKIIDSAENDILIIDARNPEEYQEVHIKNAINIPEKKLFDHADMLPEDRSAMIIFYCNGVKCGKSKKAAKKALELEYINVFVYEEGMPVWEEKGMPIYSGPDYEKKIETTRLSPTELQKIMNSDPDSYMVVDVRDPGEFEEGHIPGAINIPAASFATRSAILDKNKKIIVYCNSGGRSYNAYRKLMKLSYKKIFQSLFFDWKEQKMPIESAAEHNNS